MDKIRNRYKAWSEFVADLNLGLELAMGKNELADPQVRLNTLRKRPAPYWESILPGLALGYRSGIKCGTWLVRMYDPHNEPTRRQEKLGIADDTVPADGDRVLSYEHACDLALARFRGVRREHWTNPETRPDVYLVKDALELYIAWLEKHRQSAKRTDEMARCYIMDNSLGSTPIKNLSTTMIRAWHEKIAESEKMTRAGKSKSGGRRIPPGDSEELETQRRARRSTANRVLGILKAALNHYSQLDAVPPADPAIWKRVKSFRRAGNKRQRVLTPDEQKALVKACPSDLKELVLGGLLTGARFGSLANLRVAGVVQGVNCLQLLWTKTKDEVTVPLTVDAEALFRKLMAGKKPEDAVFTKADGQPWGRNQYSRGLKTAVAAAGIQPIVFHEMRHTFASNLLMAGVDPHAVAAAIGHSDLQMIYKHYGHLIPTWVQREVREKAPYIGLVEP